MPLSPKYAFLCEKKLFPINFLLTAIKKSFTPLTSIELHTLNTNMKMHTNPESSDDKYRKRGFVKL